MSEHRAPDLDPRDQAFVERIARGWGCPRLTAAECARLERVPAAAARRRSAPWLLAPVAAAAAAVALVLLPGQPSPPPRPEVATTVGQSMQTVDWEVVEWIDGSENGAALDEILPPDYQALAALIELDGTENE